MKTVFPKKFAYMASKEHELTDRRGAPVTLLKDRAGKKRVPVFLVKHPGYPDIGCIDSKKGRHKIESFECHGFCNTRDHKPE